MIWEIMTYLDIKNIENIRTVNKSFYLVNQNNNFWKQLLYDHYKTKIKGMSVNFKKEYILFYYIIYTNYAIYVENYSMNKVRLVLL